MQTTFHTAPRWTAFAFAAVMTVATLLGVSQLADQQHAEVQLSQTASAARA